MQPVTMTSLGRDARASRLIILMLSLGFVALLCAAVATFWIQRQNEQNAESVAHTLAVEASLGAFASASERMETARRGVLLTGNPSFTSLMDEANRNAQIRLNELDALIADNDSQRARVARLRALLAAYQRNHGQSVALSGAARQRMIANLTGDAVLGNIRAVRAVVGEMLDEELGLLRAREARQQRTQALFGATLIATGLLILLVAVGTLYLVGKNLIELRESREELRRLNENLEGLVDVRTAELQRANGEIQRFAYIVSHDLRSPLVNVMGFTAELETARKAIANYVERSDAEGWQAPDSATRFAVEEDLPEAIGFIRSSTQKMDRLINAILNLSRQGRRTLTPETLDLTALAQGIADSLEHRVQESGTTLTVEPLPAIVNDRLAVEQILSNLIENALKYLQPGRSGVIGVTGRTDQGRAIVAVADNGRGIDPRDHERVFDLFRRSGVQDQPGEGIGLAHARALAYRLGGFIEVRSAVNEGSTFCLNLPIQWTSGEENA
ncbi:sensor histidine kinase [Novosphingopyxis sp.]|uniref:sensor histidine kinase n=1 Tax=Novosphingopyxis sp. TaxID=2709690 RepID=UPI003B591A21